jgi:multidrug efflux pump subunit AcrB
LKALIITALQRPVTVFVMVLGLLLISILALRRMPLDMFPDLGLPTIYISQPYGGLSPEQMEGFITSNLEYYCIYLTGLEYVESKSVQHYALIKLQFHPGTDMDQAMAEVVTNVNRARSKMPEGTVPPFIVRYDAGTVPVGQLVFSSEDYSLTEIQDLALFKVRPMFSSLEGVSAPPPFGGNQKSVIIQVNPDKLRSLGISADQIVDAIHSGNLVTPAGNVRIGDQNLLTPINSVVTRISDLEDIVVKRGEHHMVFVRDVATVFQGADVTTGYALINGKRSVYIPVSKRSDASTWQVVQHVRRALPAMQAAVPEGIRVSYEFDQSDYLLKSLKALVLEALLGALLTGLMVFLFLRDLRSALIVMITIPIALMGAVTLLYLAGETLNLMTLGGLALAVGILVDEATVTVENIHRHLEMGKEKRRAILDASLEISVPKLLILLCILTVFVPSLFMSGLPKAMFQPLSLAVGFAMMISFLLSQSLVPVLSGWILPDRNSLEVKKHSYFSTVQLSYAKGLSAMRNRKSLIVTGYILFLTTLLWYLFGSIGTEVFPTVDSGQFQFRLQMQAGVRMERMEETTVKALHRIEQIAGAENIEITSAFVGTQPSSFPNNTIYLWTNGAYEAVVQIKLKDDTGISLAALREKIRSDFASHLPGVSISFEPADLVDKVMSLGSTTPVDIAILGRDLEQSRSVAESLLEKIKNIPWIRDAQMGVPLDYPSASIDIDRERAGRMNVTVEEAGHAIIAGTSSSRFITPVHWLDTKSGNTYQVQVEFPQQQMNSIESIENIPIGENGNALLLRDIASVTPSVSYGVYQRYNQQRYVNITANLEGIDPGTAYKDLDKVIASMGSIPKGVKIQLKGQSQVLTKTIAELRQGLIIALIAICILITAYFQSFRIGLAILVSSLSVLAGAFILLHVTGHTLNIQSFTGTVMALGVSIANSILLINAAEHLRLSGIPVWQSGSEGASWRLRPILMTAAAMISGMIPLAVGLGQTGNQIAPLGIAAIGGLLLSTIITLFVLPVIYGWLMQNRYAKSLSLLPHDE